MNTYILTFNVDIDYGEQGVSPEPMAQMEIKATNDGYAQRIGDAIAGMIPLETHNERCISCSVDAKEQINGLHGED